MSGIRKDNTISDSYCQGHSRVATRVLDYDSLPLYELQKYIGDVKLLTYPDTHHHAISSSVNQPCQAGCHPRLRILSVTPLQGANRHTMLGVSVTRLIALSYAPWPCPIFSKLQHPIHRVKSLLSTYQSIGSWNTSMAAWLLLIPTTRAVAESERRPVFNLLIQCSSQYLCIHCTI